MLPGQEQMWGVGVAAKEGAARVCRVPTPWLSCSDSFCPNPSSPAQLTWAQKRRMKGLHSSRSCSPPQHEHYEGDPSAGLLLCFLELITCLMAEQMVE